MWTWTPWCCLQTPTSCCSAPNFFRSFLFSSGYRQPSWGLSFSTTRSSCVINVRTCGGRGRVRFWRIRKADWQVFWLSRASSVCFLCGLAAFPSRTPRQPSSVEQNCSSVAHPAKCARFCRTTQKFKDERPQTWWTVWRRWAAWGAARLPPLKEAWSSC